MTIEQALTAQRDEARNIIMILLRNDTWWEGMPDEDFKKVEAFLASTTGEQPK